jgi:hypothetical protein
MAITIQEQPYDLTRLGQKLIVRATSTNVGNDGFKFVFRLFPGTPNETDFYISPNPSSQGIFDLFDAVKDFPSVEPTKVFVDGLDEYFQNNQYPLFPYILWVYEAWLVDGVLTIDEGSAVYVNGSSEGTYLIPASYNISDGYRPNPENDYGFKPIEPFNVVSTSLMMGDRNTTTHLPDTYLNDITNLGGQYYVAIPTRKSENDWGVLNVVSGIGGSYDAGGLYVKYVLKKADGTTVEQSTTLSGGGANKRLAHIPAYPANLNVGSYSPVIPKNFTDWQWYSVQLFEDSELTKVRSALYVFYPVEDDCIYENVRLCWWSPIKGGFDFFNFSKVSQKSVDVERKRIKKIIGNYGDASSGFTFATSDRGLSETSVSPTTYLDITSDWIQEGEYRLLSNLVRSRYVWIINDDGNATPVVVDTNSFTERRERNGKLSRVTFRLRYSNENFYY